MKKPFVFLDGNPVYKSKVSDPVIPSGGLYVLSSFALVVFSLLHDLVWLSPEDSPHDDAALLAGVKYLILAILSDVKARFV